MLLLSPMLAQRHGKIGMSTQHAFQFTSMVVVLVPAFASLVYAVGARDGEAHTK